MRQFLASDPIQPRSTGAADVAESKPPLVRDRERFRQQVRRDSALRARR